MSEKEKKTRMHVIEGNKKEWDKVQYDRIGIATKKENKTRDRVNAAAAKKEISAQQYMISAIEKQLTLDGYPAPASEDQKNG